MAIHFPGLRNIDNPPVFVFPELHVCMDCGITEFAIPETELGLLTDAECARRIQRETDFRNSPTWEHLGTIALRVRYKRNT